MHMYLVEALLWLFVEGHEVADGRTLGRVVGEDVLESIWRIRFGRNLQKKTLSCQKFGSTSTY
jgi:hypothetical protein